MSTWSELDEAISVLKNKGCKNIVLFQCTSEYPCPSEHAGLDLIKKMKDRYDLPIGFSDHTLGVALPIAAVCMGASHIEKHFSLSKLMYGPDASIALTPEELSELVSAIRTIEVALQASTDKDMIASSLAKMKQTFEKKIVVSCDCSAGMILDLKHLSFKKSDTGIPANRYKELIGKKLKVDINKDTCVAFDMIVNDFNTKKY
jgi:sialic acid synthase SpsE